MQRMLLLAVLVVPVLGCALPPGEISRNVCENIILPEQLKIPYNDPPNLSPAPIPNDIPPRTVSQPRPETPQWQVSLDDAIRISLENAQVIRTLTGTTAVSSGQTIYDTAAINTTIDQAQARFDPVLHQNNLWNRLNTPLGEFSSTVGGFSATFNPSNPLGSLGAVIGSVPVDGYSNEFGLTKINEVGGQWAVTWKENPTAFPNQIVPFAAQDFSSLEFSYTQPLLQGAGFQVNLAPIVIARLNTEQSYFQYKDTVQEMVRGVIEAYWLLVQARTDAWARKIQVEQSREAYQREQARLKSGLADLTNVAQARVTYNQFRASLVAAEANVLTREGALRNLIGLPPEDCRQIVPVSAPTDRRLSPNWDALIQLAEQRRPDIIELKIILDADKQRLVQAENQTLPKLDATALYRFNGLAGTTLPGGPLGTGFGEYNDWQVGLNFSVPLGLRAGRAMIRDQQLLIQKDRVNIDQGVHAAIHELAATVRDLDSAYEQYLAYKETRVAADQNLRVQIEQFRVGRTIYLNVLQALNDWGNAITSEAQQLLFYNTALALLERRAGTILETHGLVFFEETYRSIGPLGIPGHGRMYPEALIPTGSSELYPSTGQPAENAFDLQKPDIRDSKGPVNPPPNRLP
jgi:outer membrane protein TolC